MTGGDDSDSMVGGDSTGQLYFTSTFQADDPSRSLWTIGEDGLVTQQFSEDGAYIFTNRRVSRAVTSIANPAQDYTDATISMEAALQPESNAASGYGIVFRYLDEGNYYVFAADGIGRYSIWVRANNRWRELRGADSDWTANDRIEPLGEVNQLTVDIIGNRFIGYVNSELVADVTDDTIAAGKVGIYLATTNDSTALARVRVTHYSVKDIAESMTTSMTGSEDGSPARDLR
jgi:hypothetical protein